MRQAEGQASPEPKSPGSPSPPPRRRGWRRWLVFWMLQLLVLLGAGASGWFWPTDAWCGWGLAFVPAVTIAQLEERTDNPELARPRWVAWAISYGVLLGGAGPVGA
jgi:hypothetical protein